MPRVVLTAEVEDGARWEAGFKTHGDVFRNQTAVSPIQYTVNDQNEVAITCEVADINAFFTVLAGPETAEAMAFDGVKKETVKVFVMDGELSF